MTTYVLSGGCFWCLDAIFRQLRGVSSSLCGYAGDTAENANYYRVAYGYTKHAESVQVGFDETIIPAEIILDIFFLIHDPTSLDRQGADTGPQYRSAMFYADETEKEVFERAIERAQKNWDKPIVTSLEPLTEFYEAEPEHQDFFSKYPASGYCSIVIVPKVIKARKEYAKWFTPTNFEEV